MRKPLCCLRLQCSPNCPNSTWISEHLWNDTQRYKWYAYADTQQWYHFTLLIAMIIKYKFHIILRTSKILLYIHLVRTEQYCKSNSETVLALNYHKKYTMLAAFSYFLSFCEVLHHLNRPPSVAFHTAGTFSQPTTRFHLLVVWLQSV